MKTTLQYLQKKCDIFWKKNQYLQRQSMSKKSQAERAKNPLLLIINNLDET